MSTNNERNDSVAIRVDGFNGEEKIGGVLTLEVINSDCDSRSAVKGSGESVIIALDVDSILKRNLTLS
jgi:hypothetical protein